MEESDEEILQGAFDPESFRSLGHQFIDELADSLRETISGNLPVRHVQSPEESCQFWETKLRENSDPESLLADVLEQTFRSHHPKNMGHQVGPVLPFAALTDLAGSLLDIGNGVFEVGDPSTPMEKVVLDDLANRIGLPGNAGGVFTSGGSLGNLTALLAMRECKATNSKPAILVSEESHYCVSRAARILGLDVTTVKTDCNFRLDTGDLDRAFTEAESGGNTVIGVVGNAGSTATGKIDPLEQIAKFCKERNVWFHIDAAHAGGFIFSSNGKEMLKGIECADSIVIDFHKMLLSPSLLTAVLYRDDHTSWKTFAQKADYLWREDQTHEWWDAAKRTLECTRPMLGLRAFAVYQNGIKGLFRAYTNHCLETTRLFTDAILAADNFELLTEPEVNIVCYRYNPGEMDTDQLNQLNEKIRQNIVESGDFYIVQVEKNGSIYLRSALMSPFIDRNSISELLDRIRKEAAS